MKTRSKNKTPWKPTRRNAVLLLAVLLVISAVTLSTLAFMQSMLLGHEESRLTGENIQARYAAESGIDAARLFVASSRAARREAGGTFDNPNRFQAIPVLQTVDPLNPCNYTLIAPSLNESGKYSGVRFGLQNESARLNLNALPIIDSALSIPPELANLASSNLMPTPSGSNSGASGGSGNTMLDGLASANKSGSLGRDLLRWMKRSPMPSSISSMRMMKFESMVANGITMHNCPTRMHPSMVHSTPSSNCF
jgi:hypothetical protein